MADLNAIRRGLAANLSSITDVQVSAYDLSNPTPPCIYVTPETVDYTQTMGDQMEPVFTVRAVVAFTTDIGSQVLLDEFLATSGDRSISAAVEADRTLGGACDSLVVEEAHNYRPAVLDNGSRVLACDWRVRILT